MVARHYVFSAALPDEFEMIDRLLSETAFVRILVRGDWGVQEAPGKWVRPGNALFFGSNSRPMEVRVRGPFHVIGIAIRPCGWYSLFDEGAYAYADRMARLDQVWPVNISKSLEAACSADADDQDIIAACEAAIERRRSDISSGTGPSEPMRIFERIARDDSTMPISEVARQCGIGERQLERLTRSHFGQTPKAIMRRSRFLDMAAAMRGLSDPSDADLAALRYFDQSHQTREFRRFSGMTPLTFQKTPTPLLTAGLELRQERKAAARAA